MTVNEMIISFDQYYDKVTNLAAPGYEDSEILLFLNNEQDNFIKKRLFGEKFMPPAFEDNQKRVADLRPLVTETLASAFSSNSYFSVSKGMSISTDASDLMFVIGLSVQVTRTEPMTTEGWIECDFVKREYARRFDTTSTNKPHFIRPKYYISGSVIYVIFDAYTTGYADSDHSYNLKYIKTPTVLIAGGDCDLEPYTHQEIVDMAVRNAMQVSQDQRFETKLIEERVVKTQ